MVRVNNFFNDKIKFILNVKWQFNLHNLLNIIIRGRIKQKK